MGFILSGYENMGFFRISGLIYFWGFLAQQSEQSYIWPRKQRHFAARCRGVNTRIMTDGTTRLDKTASSRCVASRRRCELDSRRLKTVSSTENVKSEHVQSNFPTQTAHATRQSSSVASAGCELGMSGVEGTYAVPLLRPNGFLSSTPVW